MTKQEYKAAMRTRRIRSQDLPLAADGAPQWTAEEWLESVTPPEIRVLWNGPYDSLADRAFYAKLGPDALKRAIRRG